MSIYNRRHEKVIINVMRNNNNIHLYTDLKYTQIWQHVTQYEENHSEDVKENIQVMSALQKHYNMYMSKHDCHKHLSSLKEGLPQTLSLLKTKDCNIH